MLFRSPVIAPLSWKRLHREVVFKSYQHYVALDADIYCCPGRINKHEVAKIVVSRNERLHLR